MPNAPRRPYPDPFPVESARQIRALRSTVRQDIIDRVQAMGAVSVPDLARELGRPADALYYHVRALKAAGLLLEAGSRVRGRHTEMLYATRHPERRLMLRYRGGQPETTRPVRAVVGSMLRAARREFDLAITDPACRTEGPARELWPGRIVGWLTPGELARVNAYLAALTRLMSSPRSGARNRLYSLQFLLSPCESAAPHPGLRTPRTRRPR
jgi:hypothetical protein